MKEFIWKIVDLKMRNQMVCQGGYGKNVETVEPIWNYKDRQCLLHPLVLATDIISAPSCSSLLTGNGECSVDNV